MQRSSPLQKNRLFHTCVLFRAPSRPSHNPSSLKAPQLSVRPSKSLVQLSATSEDDPSLFDPTPSASYPVQLRVYNIDRWGLAPVGGKLLRKEVDGIYHVAVAVHGHEYWFDHQVEKLNLEDVFYVRGFSPAFLYEMGSTSEQPDETDAYCFGFLKEKYNIKTYDCFYHNCHHFARDLCLKLTNKPIPQWLIDHGEQGLSELTEENAKLVRMVSNKIARIMMVSWGRYSKHRFVEKHKQQTPEKDAASLDALNPIPLAGRATFFADAQPSGVSNEGLREILPESLLQLDRNQDRSRASDN